MPRLEQQMDMTTPAVLFGMAVANGMMNGIADLAQRRVDEVVAMKEALFEAADAESRENIVRIAREALDIAAREIALRQQLEAEIARLQANNTALEIALREA